MGVWSGERVARHIHGDDIKINPNGVDLGISEISRIEERSTVIIQNGSKVIYPSIVDVTKSLLYDDDEVPSYSIPPGVYVVRLKNEISIPNGAVGLVFPRSTLNRYGIMMQQTAVWDSGYRGYGTLTVRTDLKELRIGVDEKWFQLIFIDSDSVPSSDLYNGSYQNEK